VNDCVILSVRQGFADAICASAKTIELRRRFTRKRVTRALLYVSRTRKAIVAQAEIRDVLHLPICELWSYSKEHAAVSRREFESYFMNLQAGFAILLGKIEVFAGPIALEEMSKQFGVRPPQSWAFAPIALAAATQGANSGYDGTVSWNKFV